LWLALTELVQEGGGAKKDLRREATAPDLNKLEDLKAKIAELEKEIKELKEAKANSNNCDVKIVTSERR